MSRSNSLPVKIAKRIAGRCLYPGCDDDSLDGSDYCDPHDAHERGRDAGKKRRRRQRLADQGMCIVEGCGRKIGKRKRLDGTVQQRRCASCGKARRARTRPKDGVPDGASGVPERHFRLETGPNFRGVGTYQTQRYVGRGHRGRLTREEQIDERIRSVDFAMDELRKFRRALQQLKLPEVLELPKIQREAAGREASFFGEAAVRHIQDSIDELAG